MFNNMIENEQTNIHNSTSNTPQINHEIDRSPSPSLPKDNSYNTVDVKKQLLGLASIHMPKSDTNAADVEQEPADPVMELSSPKTGKVNSFADDDIQQDIKSASVERKVAATKPSLFSMESELAISLSESFDADIDNVSSEASSPNQLVVKEILKPKQSVARTSRSSTSESRISRASKTSTRNSIKKLRKSKLVSKPISKPKPKPAAKAKQVPPKRKSAAKPKIKKQPTPEPSESTSDIDSDLSSDAVESEVESTDEASFYSSSSKRKSTSKKTSKKSRSSSLKKKLKQLELDSPSDSDHEPVQQRLSRGGGGWFSYFGQMVGMSNEPVEKQELTETKLQEIFSQVDINNSGLLDLNEFKKAVKLLGYNNDLDPKREFKRIDSDQSGFLDYEEFRRAMLGRGTKEITLLKLKKVFKKLDRNRNKTMEFDEFKLAARYIGFGSIGGENDLKELFEKVDTNESGVIDWKEFVTAVLHQPCDYELSDYSSDEELDEIVKENNKRKKVVNVTEKPRKSQRKTNKTKGIDEFSLKCNRIWKQVDEDKNGFLEYSEFVKAGKLVVGKQNVKQIKRAFIMADVNDDGRIDFSEFVKYMKKIAEE